MSDTGWVILIGAAYIAGIMTLVRPSSKGPQIINSVLGALTDLVKGVTGYTVGGSNSLWPYNACITL